MSLTIRRIEQASYAGKGNARYILWDNKPRGLGLRVLPSGRKSFVLSYRNTAGLRRLISLGDLGVLSLEQARHQAEDELRAIRRDHTDPLAQKRSRQLEARTDTVQALFEAYLADRKPKREAALRSTANLYILPEFGKRPWREVRRSEVRAWHQGIKRTYAANRALQAMRAAIYWRLWQEDDSAGEREGKRDTRNPCAGVPLRPEYARQVRLEIGDLPKLESAIDSKVADPYVRALFRFLLATGARRGEALKLKWADVTLQGTACSVTFRDTKAGGDRLVPLSALALRLLKSLPKIDGNPFVFAGHRAGEALSGVVKAWERVRAEAGLPHLRIHDLRRSFGSWLGDEGFSSKQIGTVLGHRTDITSRVYMALGDESKRDAVNAVQRLMRRRRK